jgi:hypothetical protein
MTETIHGRARGKTIELDEDSGVADGQEVGVQLKIREPKKRLPGPPLGWQPGRPSATAGLDSGGGTSSAESRASGSGAASQGGSCGVSSL